MNEDKYIEGFNAGYQLKQNLPDLYEVLTKTPSLESDYLQGFREGGIQLDKEREKAKDDLYVNLDRECTGNCVRGNWSPVIAPRDRRLFSSRRSRGAHL